MKRLKKPPLYKLAITAVALLGLGCGSVAMAIGPTPQGVSPTAQPPAFDRAEPAPKIAQSATVTEKLDHRIPLDIALVNERGETVPLSQFFQDQKKPVLINLGYYSCPMLCGLVLNGLTDSLKKLAWTPGQEFEVLTVSIDPTESYKLAAAKKKNILKELDRPGAGTGWHFLTAQEAQVRRLADAVGFGYAWDDTQKQYAHSAVLIVATPDGRVSRYLYGIEFPEKTLRLSLVEASEGKIGSTGVVSQGIAAQRGLVEASEGKIGSTLDRVLLLCYHFDPQTGRYSVAASNLMRAGGALTVLVVGGLIGAALYREKRRKPI